MARHGPRLKVLRRLGTALPGLTRKSAERRPYPPGAHGARAGRRPSEYRRRLEEKQKLRLHYGVTETQLRRYFARAARQSRATGPALLALLERRLDNVVFRLGFAPTIPAARQLVAHGHVQVNGRRVNRPSYLTERGNRIEMAPRARRMAPVVEAVEHGSEVRLPAFLEASGDDRFTGQVVGEPAREDVPFPVDEVLIIEFYAR